MFTFFKSNTQKELYDHLEALTPGNQPIRQCDKLVRLLAAADLLDETQAQQMKRDAAEQVHGFNTFLEFEKIFANTGVVIAPLRDDFKHELAATARMH